MTAALAGNAAQRAAALAALDAVTRGERDGKATRDAKRRRAVFRASPDVAMSESPRADLDAHVTSYDEEDDAYASLPVGD